MGGTSTDVSHYAGEYERAFETLVAGVRMRAPMMQIHTVAAGGGSILHFDGARTGSARTAPAPIPGPACYRRGGPLAVTDCNVMLGKLQPEFFPAVFGPGADAAARRRGRAAESSRRSRTRSDAATGDDDRSPVEVAEGFLRIAVENMANAIKEISIQRGYDVTEYTLACFGGAGGQHACLVADALGMTKVFMHPYAGVSVGLRHGPCRRARDARARRSRRRSADATLTEILDAKLAALADDARAELLAQGCRCDANIEPARRRRIMRYEGTDIGAGRRSWRPGGDRRPLRGRAPAALRLRRCPDNGTSSRRSRSRPSARPNGESRTPGSSRRGGPAADAGAGDQRDHARDGRMARDADLRPRRAGARATSSTARRSSSSRPGPR